MGATRAQFAFSRPASVAAGHPAARTLAVRVVCLALLFAAEAIAFSLWLDTASLAHDTGLAHSVARWGPDVLRAIIGFAAIFFTFLFISDRSAFEAAADEDTPVGRGMLAAHCAAVALLALVSARLFAGGAPPSSDLLAAGWLAAGAAAIVFGAFAFVAARTWLRLARRNVLLMMCAAGCAVLGVAAGDLTRMLWRPATYATFSIVKLLLRPLLPQLISDPAMLLIGTPHFAVRIFPSCSGLEGAALMLGFGIAWLVLFRRECRFPNALLLVPGALATSFLLNSVRIAALVLIGNAGARQIALRGFHSQAGWIFFNLVAVGFCVVARQAPFFISREREAEAEAAGSDATAAYLLPFLAILAAGMVAAASSAGFEWLYPLRVVAALGALWWFRRSYARLDWRCGWLAPVTGAAVFAMWIAADRLLHGAGTQSMPVALAASPASARMSWIALRIAGAVVTVPIAEELAFRGFLMRRLVSADFEGVDLQRVPWYAMLASSVAFGLLHGSLWMAGITAGAVFALLAMRRGRIGDAVVAHATANALVAAYVLVFARWGLW